MTSARPHRRRRVASDEAHAWARSLRLDNPYAKSVLQALTLYVNDEAACFVSIGQLAEDTDLSDDTVRKRLKFLEDVGAIVRFPRWRDENGRANTEGRGKRTTDDIRLLIDADPDEIEARARGDGGPQDDTDAAEISPRSQQGLNPAATDGLGPPVSPPASPRPAVGQPSQSGEGLTSEPEPEPSPQPPSGGDGDHADQEEGKQEPEHFAEFWTGYPGYRVMDRGRALQVFSALTDSERALARAAVPLLADDLTKLKRRPKDAYKWLRDRGFEQYPHARLPTPPPVKLWIDDPAQIAALRTLNRILGLGDLALDWNTERTARTGVWRYREPAADLLALGQFADVDELDWQVAEPEMREFNAWRHRLHEWTGIWAEPRMVMRRGTKKFEWPPGVFKDVQNRLNGIPVPCRWPPKKDGTIYSDDHTSSEGSAS